LETLRARARLLATLRAYFARQGVMEVATPIRSLAATVDPHIESLRSGEDAWLHTSPEFAMKRLLASGSGPIYQLCHVFRADEVGSHHQPEFTLLEWYRPGFDHLKLMDEVEALIQATGAPVLCYERISYGDAFRRYAGVDPFNATADHLCSVLARAGVALATAPEPYDAHDVDFWRELCMASVVSPRLGEQAPCFVYDYPASQAALARVDDSVSPPVARRFELFWRGVELANGFHELNDAAEQRRRFENDLQQRHRRGQCLPPMDEALIEAIEYGLPDCAGVALGVDRLLMLLLKLPTVAETQAFDAERA